MIGKFTALNAHKTVDDDGNIEVKFSVSPNSKYIIGGIMKAIKDSGKELTVTVDEKRNQRSLEQNRLMWSLLEIMALHQNGGRTGGVNAEDLYLNFIEKYGAKYEYLMCVPEALKGLKQQFRAIKEVERREYNRKEMIVCKCFYGSSKFDTKEMTQLIDGIFDELANMGIEDNYQSAVKSYWVEWLESKGENK